MCIRDRAWSELHRWLLREYVRKVGFYAIALYSGQLTLADAEPTVTATPLSRRDLKRAAAAVAPVAEPLRIVVLGRSNAGKSSLINALFGKLTAKFDVLPDTTAVSYTHLDVYKRQSLGRDHQRRDYLCAWQGCRLLFRQPAAGGTHGR